LNDNNIVCIEGIDTRALTHHLRMHGSQPGVIVPLSEKDRTYEELENHLGPYDPGLDLSRISSNMKDYHINKVSNPKYKVVIIDFGVRSGISQCLSDLGCEVKIVSYTDSILNDIYNLKPDGVLISNGPGDPRNVTCIDQIRALVYSGIPVFGICLGHQLIAHAVGARISKMTTGHRGVNHPVRNLETGGVEITSQNHGFVVEDLPENVTKTHISLFDGTLEGMRFRDYPVFCVQYHPESRPGPNDSKYLFDQFLDLIEERKV